MLFWMPLLGVAWIVFFFKAKAWLPYYMLATTGFALFAVVISREVLPIETGLRTLTAASVHHVTGVLGIHSLVLDSQPGSLVVATGSDWTHLNMGLESSGLLESAALAGLVVFFPGNSGRHRAVVLVVALGAVFVANTLRVSMIVASVAWVGGPALDFRHMILGRIMFFVLAICIYWFVVTRPTLRAAQARMEARH